MHKNRKKLRSPHLEQCRTPQLSCWEIKNTLSQQDSMQPEESTTALCLCESVLTGPRIKDLSPAPRELLRTLGEWQGTLSRSCPSGHSAERAPSLQQGVIWEPSQMETSTHSFHKASATLSDHSGILWEWKNHPFLW